MKNSKALLLRILLTLIVLYALGAFFASAPGLIGKNFFESYDYQTTQNEYINKLQNYVLNPADKEATLKALNVSQEEIHFYRHFYGTEAEQILNIQQQYESKIEEANNVESPNEAYIKALTAERDLKIAEIQKNFADDQVVIDKILAIKSEAVQNYFNSYKENKQDFLDEYNYFGYSLTNKETKEVVSKSVNGTPIYRFNKTFDTKRPVTISVNDYVNYAGILDRDLNILYTEATYSGAILLSKDYIESSGLGWNYRGFLISKYLNYVLWAIGLIAFILLMTKFKWSMRLFEPLEPYYEKVKNKPIDIHAVGLAIVVFFTISTFDTGSHIISRIAYNGSHVVSLSFFFEVLAGFAIRIVLLSLTIYLAWALVKRLAEQNKKMLWQQSITFKFVEQGKHLFLNRSIGIQTLFMFAVFFLGGVGFFIGVQDGEYFIFYCFLFFFILMPITFIYLWRMGYLNKIMKQTQLMAEGRLTESIKVKGNSPFAKHAANLNVLQEGVRKSVTEQAKSERLKTELITNVSHDLRTPLTSIITYTDLLKSPSLTDEEREKYVGILDKKAERLKVLIEDLFEVSKMASGNIELVKNRVDIAQLLQQITGEHAGDFEASNLDLRVSIGSQPIYANVDGQKLWRVCDNLLNNARKYSLTGTRIYVDLREEFSRVVLTVKNVSQYELEGDAMELAERFKRADLARHTEGSGLGLAIATSIVQLHGGTLDITADGDLFKVTVVLPC